MSDAPSWLRLYRSILSNRKTGNLSDAEFGRYIKAIILASPDSGILPPIKTLLKYVDASYRINPSRYNSFLDAMISYGLLDKLSTGDLTVHNYSKRQWKKDAEKPENQQTLNKLSTNCCNELLNTQYENKELSFENDTKKAGTETDTEYLIYNYSPQSPQFSIFWDQVLSGNFEEVQKLVARLRRRTSHPASDLQKATDHVETIFSAWRSAPGVMRHKSFSQADREAARQAIRALSSGQESIGDTIAMICLAITRYGAFCENADGTYRKAYRWTFYEFVKRKQFNNLRRFSADNWQDTCREFKRPESAPKSVSSLISRLDRVR
jgi:hypothetical protein